MKYLDVAKKLKFRVFELSSGKFIFLGRSAENNEVLVSQVKPTELVLHTVAPGSPFCNVKGRATKKDVAESAVYCAKFSRKWRDGRKDIVVHVFRGSDIYKTKNMKKGTVW